MRNILFFYILFVVVVVHASSMNWKIMPLGDSITYGCGDSYSGCTSSDPTHIECGPCVGGYRTPLYQNLTNSGFKFSFVGSQQSGPSYIDRNNEGHPGWRIDQVSADITRWINATQPDIFLVHLGTNDASQGSPNSTIVSRMYKLVMQISFFTIQKQLHLLFDNKEIFEAAPYSTIYVATIIERFCDGIANVSIPLTNEFNAAVPNMVNFFYIQGFDARYVAQLNQSTDYADGCVHPNPKGYQKMANVWAHTLLSDFNFSTYNSV